MEKIVKIAENNIEVQTIYFEDADGTKEIIIDRQSYGQEKIDRKKEQLLKQLDYWSTLTQVEIDKAKQGVQEQLDFLDKVQKEMDKND